MTRGFLFGLAGAGSAVAAAAALSIGIAEGPAASQEPQAQEAPAWPTSERVELTQSQLLQAYATGDLNRPIKTMLNVRERMRYGDFVWNDRKVPAGPLWIRVDLESQLISVFRGGHEIGTAVILYGAQEKQTPSGTFRIMERKKDHQSTLYDAPMPYMLRLTGDGVAIHASNVRWGAATHGCIGVPDAFAERLFELARVGDEVLIVGDPAEPTSA